MEVTLTIQAPELAQAISELAQAIKQASVTVDKPIQQVTPAQTEGPNTIEAIDTTRTGQTESEKQTEPEVKLEVVRTKLAELSRAGKQAQVKELLAEFGATKLSEVDPSRYVELLAKAEELA